MTPVMHIIELKSGDFKIKGEANIIIVLKVHFHSLRFSLQSYSYLGQ